jgi:hypothetical protein
MVYCGAVIIVQRDLPVQETRRLGREVDDERRKLTCDQVYIYKVVDVWDLGV